jgi:hypothetical protein
MSVQGTYDFISPRKHLFLIAIAAMLQTAQTLEMSQRAHAIVAIVGAGILAVKAKIEPSEDAT